MAKPGKDFAKMSLEERATLAYEQSINQEAEDVDTAPMPPLPANVMSQSATKAAAMASFRQSIGLDANGNQPGSAPPNVMAVFENPNYLKLILNGPQEGTRDRGEEPKNIKVRKSIMPDDIYDGSLDQRLFLWFVYFMHPAFGEELVNERTGMTKGGFYIQRVADLATGYGVKPLSFLREAVWTLVRDGKMLKGADLSDLPTDRNPEHDEDNHPENIGLRALLEYSVFQAVQNESRRHGCAPKHILTHGIKAAIDAGVFKP